MQSLWMLFATFVFAAMGVCVKFASSLYSTSEIVMYRGTVGTVLLLILIKIQGGTLKTSFPWHHLWRSVIGVLSLWLWFYSIAYLPLATSMTLNYTAPIWIAVFLFASGLRSRGQRLEWGLSGAILLSFIGVTLLLRPSINAQQWAPGIVALLSGIVSAMAYMQVRQLGLLGEPEYRVVFYFSLTGAVAGMLGSIFIATTSSAISSNSVPMWHAHTLKGALLLFAIGACALSAQIAMTRAYRLGKTLVTANLQYTGIIFSSIWGVALWNDKLGWAGWLGISLILLSGITATYYNTRNAASPIEKEMGDVIANEV